MWCWFKGLFPGEGPLPVMTFHRNAGASFRGFPCSRSEKVRVWKVREVDHGGKHLERYEIWSKVVLSWNELTRVYELENIRGTATIAVCFH